MITTLEKQIESFEVTSPETLAAMVEHYEGVVYYTLNESVIWKNVAFRLEYNAQYRHGSWDCSNRITWRSDGASGLVKTEDFKYPPTDRRKATIEALKIAMGKHAYEALAAVCTESGVSALWEEHQAFQKERERLDAISLAKHETYLAWLNDLTGSGQVVDGAGVGIKLDLVLVELATVAQLRMRNCRYDQRFDYDGVYLEFKKSGKSASGLAKTQVRIKLSGFTETVFADLEETRVIGPQLSYRGFPLPYTWVIPPDRLQQIEAALMELSRHDRLVEIMTNGKKLGECICCGKALTDPVSRSRWVGPECTKHFQGVYQFEDDGNTTRLLN